MKNLEKSIIYKDVTAIASKEYPILEHATLGYKGTESWVYIKSNCPYNPFRTLDINNQKLLVKFPTRERPEKFFLRLDEYYSNLRDGNFEFIISCDKDDITMNNDTIKNRLSSYPNLKYFFGNNKTKIEAVNANLKHAQFDVLLLASDDMSPIKAGYDVIIKQKMKESFPDTDGVLWFNDGFQGNRLNTLSILGKKYYDRFKYIYHPSYKSLYCDTEFTDVSISKNKVKYFDIEIIKHVQYSIVNEKPDELYIKNDKLKDVDYINYTERKLKGYPNE